MDMKYYNASNNFSAPIVREPKPYKPYGHRSEVIMPEQLVEKISTRPMEQHEEMRTHQTERHEEISTVQTKKDSLFGNFKLDDLLLIGLIILLVVDSNDDILLLLILGYLLITGLNEG